MIPLVRYRHWKGDEYDLLGCATESTTGRPLRTLAVYRSVKLGHLKVRDAQEFIENVNWPDGVARARFTPLAQLAQVAEQNSPSQDEGHVAAGTNAAGSADEGPDADILEKFDAARDELAAAGLNIRASDWLDATSGVVSVEQCAEELVITCPKCSATHLDVGERRTRLHNTHLCLACGHLFRPKETPTVGVGFRGDLQALNVEQWMMASLRINAQLDELTRLRGELSAAEQHVKILRARNEELGAKIARLREAYRRLEHIRPDLSVAIADLIGEP